MILRMPHLYTLILLPLLVSCFTQFGETFRCYICDSKEDIECTENLPRNTRLEPKLCENITDAKYCVKTTNLYAGEFGTKRFCASDDHGSYCKYIRQPHDSREYRSCVLTCSSESCNGAVNSMNDQYLLACSLFSLIVSTTLLNYLSKPKPESAYL